MSYGMNLSDACRQVGIYAGRVLRARDAVDQGFVINLKTAKAVRLTLPLPVVGGADKTARVHYASRRRGGRLAARGAFPWGVGQSAASEAKETFKPYQDFAARMTPTK
jgi:hypothetical protein